MIVDTGVLVAAANRRDRYHAPCRDLILGVQQLTVPTMVIAEAVFLNARELGSSAEAAFINSLKASKYRLEGVDTSDLARMAELVEQYSDLPLGGTDASVVALAERLKDPVVATLDRRHFSVVRPQSFDFQLQPDMA